MPACGQRLLSTGTLCKQGYIMISDNKSTTFQLKGQDGSLMIGHPLHINDSIHWLQSEIVKPKVLLTQPTVNTVDYKIWHQRFGHPSQNVLKHIRDNTKGFSEKLMIPVKNDVCKGCAQGRMHAKNMLLSLKRANSPLELVHTCYVLVQAYALKEHCCDLTSA
jgi:hypothetical protein